MRLFKVGAASVNQTPLDWEGNLENILKVIGDAKEQGVQILCLPELCITGYGCEDHFHSTDVQRRSIDQLLRIMWETGPMVVCVGLPLLYRNALYNVTAVLQNQKILGLVAKQHLAGDGLHYEPRWFKPWPAGHRSTVDLGPASMPIGDLHFEFGPGDVRVGFEICEDAWVAERPGAHLARKGVDIILNPSASHFAFGKYEVRTRFVIEGSRAFNATYVYANLLGNEAGRAIYDGGCLIASGGDLVAAGPRFSMHPTDLVTAIVDVDATRTKQTSTASFKPDFDGDRSKDCVQGDCLEKTSGRDFVQTFPENLTRYQEFTSAITLGLYDYLRKSRVKGFALSLSGGADSAACAVLVHLMAERARTQLSLGPEFNTRNLLTCVYQAADGSSTETWETAKALAQEIGAKMAFFDVSEIVHAYKRMVGKAFEREFSWEKDDITLQNIQARARAPGIWMVANMENKLLLTTSNRSESAVGYCTMDGDTAGSIGILGGIDKPFLRKWLAYVRDTYEIKSLTRVLEHKPSAELRPGATQADEEDLMPYEILEFIEEMVISKKMGPEETFCCVSARFSHVGKAALYRYVEKFFNLWCQNQWKRERYALSFHVDSRNLDPRSWCRFPVLSGGFRQELLELKQELGLQ